MMNSLFLLLFSISAFSADLNLADRLYSERSYTGEGLAKVKQAQGIYEEFLGAVMSVDVYQIREEEKQKLIAEGFKKPKEYLKRLDGRLHKRLAGSIDEHGFFLRSNLKTVKKYCDTMMFIGDSFETKEEKAAAYNLGLNVADLTVRSYGIWNLQNLETEFETQNLILGQLGEVESQNKEEFKDLANILYIRAGLLGAWGVSGIVGKLAGARRLPDIMNNLKILTTFRSKELYWYGPYRVMGRVASQSPLAKFYKDIEKGVYLLKEAFIMTKAGNAVSVNGYNNTYYAEAMHQLHKDLDRKGKRKIRQGKKEIENGNQEKGEKLIAEGELLRNQAKMQKFKAIKLLKLYLEQDLAKLNPDYLPENQRARQSAEELLAKFDK